MTNQANADKPTLEERYSSATHASNLKVEADRAGQVDTIIAMGWSPSRVGAALMRLHSEWDGCAKPRRMTPGAIEAVAATLPRMEDGGRMVLDLATARQTANEWHQRELKMLFGKLKTLPEVRHQMTLWADKRLINSPEQRVAEIIGWWLDHTCPACEGRCKELIANTPHKSHRDCRVCRGTGETRIPHRAGNDYYVMESKTMLRYINDCVKAAQTSLKQRLRPYSASNVAQTS